MYDSLAYVYDILMEGTPYEKWVDNIERLFKKYKTEPRLILELGCGTGNITVPMAKRGYEMIGIDISVDMLNEAREKAIAENLEVLYINQDMRSFELYGSVDACISLCDSMNYILTHEDIKKVFRLIKNYLNPGGFFIFDLNTEYMFELMHKQASFGEARERTAFVCETCYNKRTRLMEYRVDVFKDAKGNGSYNRFSEAHYERAYAIDEIAELISGCGLKFAGAFDVDTLKRPNEASKRVYIVCAKDDGM